MYKEIHNAYECVLPALTRSDSRARTQHKQPSVVFTLMHIPYAYSTIILNQTQNFSYCCVLYFQPSVVFIHMHMPYAYSTLILNQGVKIPILFEPDCSKALGGRRSWGMGLRNGAPMIPGPGSAARTVGKM